MKSTKLKAFTIAEAMLAILMTIICIEILQGCLGIVKKSEQLKEPTNEIVYSYVQLNEFLKEKEHVEIDQEKSFATQLILKSLVSKKDEKPVFRSYRLEKYKKMIRLTSSDGGHIPLLFNVRSCRFIFDKDEFTIQVTEDNGKNSELIFKVDEPLKIPNEKEKVKKDESSKKSKKEKSKVTSKRAT